MDKQELGVKDGALLAAWTAHREAEVARETYVSTRSKTSAPMPPKWIGAAHRLRDDLEAAAIRLDECLDAWAAEKNAPPETTEVTS